jgi:hypothetical protein
VIHPLSIALFEKIIADWRGRGVCGVWAGLAKESVKTDGLLVVQHEAHRHRNIERSTVTMTITHSPKQTPRTAKHRSVQRNESGEALEAVVGE